MKKLLILLFIIFAIKSEAEDIKCSQIVRQFNNIQCQQEDHFAKGGFGYVFLVKNTKDSQIYALKGIKIDSESRLPQFKKQEKVIQKFKSKFVMEIIDSKYENGYYSVLSKYAKNGDLNSFLEKNGHIFENRKVALAFIYKIALGIKAVHSENFVHLDLKPENILVDDELNPFLIDFDLIMESDTEGPVRGSPVYMAPELFSAKGSIKFEKSVDIYAFGVIIYRITQKLGFPFFSNFKNEFIRSLVKGEYEIADIDSLIAYLIHSCLLKKPEERPKIDWILDYIRKVFDRPVNILNSLQLSNSKTFPEMQRIPQNLRLENTRNQNNIDKVQDNLFLQTLEKYVDNSEEMKKLKNQLKLPQIIKQKTENKGFFACFGCCIDDDNVKRRII